MIEKITSKKNENIKYILKLLRESSFRRKKKRFIIEGLRLCTEAADNGVIIDKVFYTLEIYNKFTQKVEKILKKCRSKYILDENIMENISDTVTPQGIICICEYVDKSQSLNKIEEYNKVAIYENIQDPSNMGTMLRTCEAMGIKKVFITSNSCDIYSSKVLRGSMGSIFRLEIDIINDICELLKDLRSRNFLTCGAVLEKDAISVCDIKGEKIAIVVGNEGNGLELDTIKSCEKKITIPMMGLSESLNVSVALGILLWEVTGRGSV